MTVKIVSSSFQMYAENFVRTTCDIPADVVRKKATHDLDAWKRTRTEDLVTLLWQAYTSGLLDGAWHVTREHRS